MVKHLLSQAGTSFVGLTFVGLTLVGLTFVGLTFAGLTLYLAHLVDALQLELITIFSYATIHNVTVS